MASARAIEATNPLNTDDFLLLKNKNNATDAKKTITGKNTNNGEMRFKTFSSSSVKLTLRLPYAALKIKAFANAHKNRVKITKGKMLRTFSPNIL